MVTPSSLLLAAALALDGEAALDHASKLAALGPHPFASPRSRLASEYVAAQFRKASLQEVRLQEVEVKGATGANVIGVLRAPGPGFIVVAAHHDTAQDSPGAYGSGGGVGVLIEVARALARRPERARTLVFVSLDAREPRGEGRGGLGARAYVQSLGREGREMVAAIVIDRAGRKDAATVLEAIAYADPLRPGAALVAPEGLVRAAVEGARLAGAPLAAGDPLWSWLYQPGVRAFRVADAGDDRLFLEAGLPALRLSGRRFLARDARDGMPTDTAEHLDAASLAATGRVVLGAVAVLQNAAKPSVAEGDWFLGLGQVAGRTSLLLVGAASLLPGLLLAGRAGGTRLALRGLQALVFGALLYRQPTLAVFAFVLWNVLTAFTTRWRALLVAALPVWLLFGLAALLGARGELLGVHLAVWELVLAGLAGALALLAGRLAGGRGPASRKRAGKKGLPAR